LDGWKLTRFVRNFFYWVTLPGHFCVEFLNLLTGYVTKLDERGRHNFCLNPENHSSLSRNSRQNLSVFY
jgi:hypothetical protein